MENTSIIGVIGSRTFDNYELLKQVLDDENISCIVSGGAKGADSLGERYADENEIETLIFKPEWEKYGMGAGFRRNRDIIYNSDKVYAFWDGKSKGTSHSISLCCIRNIPYVIVHFNGEIKRIEPKLQPGSLGYLLDNS